MSNSLHYHKLEELKDFLGFALMEHVRGTPCYEILSDSINRCSSAMELQELEEHREQQKLDRWNAAAREANSQKGSAHNARSLSTTSQLSPRDSSA